MFSVVTRFSCIRAQFSFRALAAASSEGERELSLEFRHALPAYSRDLPKPPRRCQSVYSMFVVENACRGVPTRIQLGRLAKLWKSLSEDEKQPYRDAYWHHRETLEARTVAFLENLTTEQRFKRAMLAIRSDNMISRRRITRLEKMLNKPKCYPVNPFKYFVDVHYNVDGRKRTEEEYEQILGTSSIAKGLIGRWKLVGRSRELARKWRSLTKEQKEVYREGHQALIAAKAQEYQEWLEKTPKDHVEEVAMLQAIQKTKKSRFNTPQKIKVLMEELEQAAAAGKNEV